MTEVKNDCEEQNVKPLLDCLRDNGITDTEIDIGYGVFELSEDGKTLKTIEGAHDGKLECDEITGSAVDNYKLCRDELEIFTNRPVPWLLDKATKKRVSKVINKIKSLLNKNEKAPDSDGYKKKMGVGLYLFAYVPEAGIIEYLGDEVANQAALLDLYGLAEFKGWLIKNGGLGLAQFVEDIKPEGTASESLKKKKGLCTEKAKIFYAILKQAALRPYAVLMNIDDLYKATNEAYFGDRVVLNIEPNEESWGHIVAALDVGEDKPWFFEFQMFGHPTLAPPYADIALPLSLSEFYQVDLLNLSISYKETKEMVKASIASLSVHNLGGSVDNYLEAIKTNPAKTNGYKGVELLGNGEFKKARDIFSNYLESKDSEIYNLVGLTYLGEKNYKKAEAYFKKAIQTKALSALYHSNLALVLMKQGKTDNAQKAVNKSLTLDPFNRFAFGILMEVLISKNGFEKAMAEVDKATVGIPKDLVAAIRYDQGMLASEHGKLDDAMKYFEKASKYGTDGIKLDSLMRQAKLLEKKGDFSGAADRCASIAKYMLENNEALLSSGILWLTLLHKAKEDFSPALDYLKTGSKMSFGNDLSELIKGFDLLVNEIPKDLLQDEKVVEMLTGLRAENRNRRC